MILDVPILTNAYILGFIPAEQRFGEKGELSAEKTSISECDSSCWIIP
jgi:hypothetical protein